MIDLERLFDSYNRQARVYPALITLLPAVISVIARYPGVLTSNAIATTLTFAVSCGLLYLLAAFARSRGKRLEQRLLRKWGGWPTTLWLRHTDSNLSKQTRARYHAVLGTHVPGIRLPTAEEEQADPASAEDSYRSAVDWLKEHCRGKEYPLVEKENAEYGFRRNLRGLKPISISVAGVALFATLVWILRDAGLTVDHVYRHDWATVLEAIGHASPALIGAAAFNVASSMFWIVAVRNTWVRQAGDQYARALLATCDGLG